MHFRVPLVDERGIELMPRTHFRWDTDLEYATRTAADGRNVFDDLPDSKAIPLNRGDLLVFNANMIHRGLYGGNRLRSTSSSVTQIRNCYGLYSPIACLTCRS